MIMLLSIGIFIGFIIGLVKFVIIDAVGLIKANQYLSYKTFGLIAQVMQEPLVKWLILMIASGFIVLILGWLVLRKTRFIKRCEKKYPRRAAVSLVVLLLLLNISVFIYVNIQGAKGPNFVIIVIDALRQDHLGCYGYSRNTSPCLDELAQTGVIFKNAYSSSPWTKPSVASLFTSLHPNNHKTLKRSHLLPEPALTMAEVLKDQGYSTYFLNAGNSNIEKSFNFHQGFDYLFNERIDAAHLTDNFLSLLPKLRKKRFFAYVHYMDTHLPYNKNKYNGLFMQNETVKPHLEPGKIDHRTVKKLEISNKLSGEDKAYLESLYDGQIRLIDENIRRIIAALKSNNILENTLMVVTSDHGEEFWDHKNFEHGHTMYNELLKVPFITAGNKLKHSTINTPVRLIDLLPTFIDILDVKYDNYNLEGVSFRNLLEGKDESPGKEIPIFAMATLYGDEKYCLIWNNKKIIINTRNKRGKIKLIGFRNKRKLEFYDITEDPLEKKNLARIEPKRAALYKKQLNKFIKAKSAFKSKKTTMDKKTKEQLKSLGYL